MPEVDYRNKVQPFHFILLVWILFYLNNIIGGPLINGYL